MARRSVLVVGGGFAGLEIVMRLAGEFDVTLVDSKSYFEYTPGVLRCMMQPEHLQRITRVYVDLATRYNFHFIQGYVEDMTESSATIRSQDSLLQVDFQFAAICCGSGYSEPIRPRREEAAVQDRLVNIEEWREDIKQSRSTLLIGGGTVGVELAGEILAQFPGKSLTLVTRDVRLMKELPEAASQYAHSYLTAHGLQIVYGQSLSEEERKSYDLVFVCAGNKSQTQFLEAHFSHVLNSQGRVVVNSYLQVQGCTHIFAAGDCALTPIAEGKTAYFAAETGKVAALNIQAISQGHALQELPQLTHFPLVSFVSLGPSAAITVFNSLVLAGRLQAWIKDQWESIAMRALGSTAFSAFLKFSHSSLILGNKLLG